MSQYDTKQFEIKLDIPISYININKGKDKPLLVFLHGYADSAASFLRRAYPEVNERFEILAVNGPFPVPQKKDNEWKQAFAWYFADFSSKSVLVHPDVSAKMLKELIDNLDMQSRDKIIIGFSQGGFFIPFLLPYLKNIKYLISIGAAYRSEDYREPLNVPLDAIHGTDDEIILYEMAEKSFLQFHKTKNPKGKFVKFFELKHTMNQASRLWLKEKLDELLK